MKKNKKIGRYIVLALVAFAIWFYRDSMQEIWWGIRQISAKEILLCLILAALYFAMDGFLIHYAMVPFSEKMTIIKGMITAYRCEFYRLITLGGGTFVAEIYYMCKEGTTVAQGTAASAYKYTIKKLSIMLCGLLGFVWLLHQDYTRALCKEYAGFTIVATVICTAIISAYFLVSISKRIAELVVLFIEALAKKIKWIAKKSDNWIAQIRNLNSEGKTLWWQWKRNVLVLLVNLCKFTIIYAVVAVLLNGSSILSTCDILAIMAMVFFLSGVIPVPSGVMSVEYIFGLFMGGFLGIGKTAPAILSFRFFSWIFPACIGGIIQLVHRFSDKDNK